MKSRVVADGTDQDVMCEAGPEGAAEHRLAGKRYAENGDEAIPT